MAVKTFHGNVKCRAGTTIGLLSLLSQCGQNLAQSKKCKCFLKLFIGNICFSYTMSNLDPDRFEIMEVTFFLNETKRLTTFDAIYFSLKC